MISPAELDDLMNRGWPGLTTVDIDGWIVRISGGVTQRANSVLPLHAPKDVTAAIAQVESLYLREGLTPTYQISPAAEPAGLDAILRGRGYEFHSPTLVDVADVQSVFRRVRAFEILATIADEPDDEWMRLWWSVDGRGGPAEEAIARRILVSCPAVYAANSDDRGVVAIGRLALVEDWGGIYCMAVRPDVRRRGYAKAVLHALLIEASERGIRNVWLQVVAHNHGARTLYDGAGFTIASRYHYRRRDSR